MNFDNKDYYYYDDDNENEEKKLTASEEVLFDFMENASDTMIPIQYAQAYTVSNSLHHHHHHHHHQQPFAIAAYIHGTQQDDALVSTTTFSGINAIHLTDDDFLESTCIAVAEPVHHSTVLPSSSSSSSSSSKATATATTMSPSFNSTTATTNATTTTITNTTTASAESMPSFAIGEDDWEWEKEQLKYWNLDLEESCFKDSNQPNNNVNANVESKYFIESGLILDDNKYFEKEEEEDKEIKKIKDDSFSAPFFNSDFSMPSLNLLSLQQQQQQQQSQSQSQYSTASSLPLPLPLPLPSTLNIQQQKEKTRLVRAAAIERWKLKRLKRNWLKRLPDSENRRVAASKRQRENGLFKRKQAAVTKSKKML